MIHLIAAIAGNGVIGNHGMLPWNLPEDLAHFKELTLHHTVIMGRRTYESIGHALPKRQNIVVSKTLSSLPDAQTAPTLKAALQLATEKEIYLIGGAQIYAEGLHYAEQLDLTMIACAPQGDTFFPEFDRKAYQEIKREIHTGPLPFQYVTLQRK